MLPTLNKNVSVWRSDKFAPPTFTHVWLKDAHTLSIHDTNVWHDHNLDKYIVNRDGSETDISQYALRFSPEFIYDNSIKLNWDVIGDEIKKYIPKISGALNEYYLGYATNESQIVSVYINKVLSVGKVRGYFAIVYSDFNFTNGTQVNKGDLLIFIGDVVDALNDSNVAIIRSSGGAADVDLSDINKHLGDLDTTTDNLGSALSVAQEDIENLKNKGHYTYTASSPDNSLSIDLVQPSPVGVISYAFKHINVLADNSTRSGIYKFNADNNGHITELSDADSRDLIYESNLPDGTTVTNGIGQITAGTDVKDLKGRTLSQIIEDMLFQVVNATMTGFSRPSITARPNIVEYRSDKLFTDVLINTYNGNGGKWVINGKEVGPYADITDASDTKINKGSSYNDSKAVDFTTATMDGEGIYSIGKLFNITYYGQLNSRGEQISEDRTEDYIAKNTFFVTKAFYATTGDELIKQPLTKNNYFEATLSSEFTTRHSFAIPANWELVKIEYYDPFMKDYQPLDVNNFQVTHTTKQTGNVPADYHIYKRIEDALSGETKIKVTFTRKDAE